MPDVHASSLSLTLPSTFDAMESSVAEVQAFLEQEEVDEGLRYNVMLLTSEALQNAMEHGHRWEARLTVTLSVAVEKDQVTVVVVDQGDGFDDAHRPDPLAQQNLEADGGRGLFLMRQFADSVVYDQGGRRLKMVFKRQPRAQPIDLSERDCSAPRGPT